MAENYMELFAHSLHFHIDRWIRQKDSREIQALRRDHMKLYILSDSANLPKLGKEKRNNL